MTSAEIQAELAEAQARLAEVQVAMSVIRGKDGSGAQSYTIPDGKGIQRVQYEIYRQEEKDLKFKISRLKYGAVTSPIFEAKS